MSHIESLIIGIFEALSFLGRSGLALLFDYLKYRFVRRNALGFEGDLILGHQVIESGATARRREDDWPIIGRVRLLKAS
jgi:hypothetical protein